MLGPDSYQLLRRTCDHKHTPFGAKKENPEDLGFFSQNHQLDKSLLLTWEFVSEEHWEAPEPLFTYF